MVKIVIVICILMTSFVLARSRLPPSLAPSLSCDTIIYDMADCVSFLINGSSELKPTPSCCSGFETVLKSNAECICEALESSAELGIDVNLTKAATLPSACRIAAPPISQCNVTSSPGAAPANPPSSGGEAPSTNSPPAVPAVPVPSVPGPARSGTYSLSACFFVLISMLVVSFSYISV